MVNGRLLPPPFIVRSGQRCLEIEGHQLTHRFMPYFNVSVCVNCQVREELVGKWAVGGPGVALVCDTWEQAMGAANESWFMQLPADQQFKLREEHLGDAFADIERQVRG